MGYNHTPWRELLKQTLLVNQLLGASALRRRRASGVVARRSWYVAVAQTSGGQGAGEDTRNKKKTKHTEKTRAEDRRSHRKT